MTTHQRRILNTAVAAFGEATGIEAHIRPATPGRHRVTDATIEIEAGRRKHFLEPK